MTRDRVIDFTHPTSVNGQWPRPELTLDITGDPRVSSLPQGEVHITIRDDCMHIEQADPHILISVQLLELIEQAPPDDVTLILATGFMPEPGLRYKGAMLTIAAANRTVTYKITEWVDWYLGCTAELVASTDVL